MESGGSSSSSAAPMYEMTATPSATSDRHYFLDVEKRIATPVRINLVTTSEIGRLDQWLQVESCMKQEVALNFKVNLRIRVLWAACLKKDSEEVNSLFDPGKVWQTLDKSGPLKTFGPQLNDDNVLLKLVYSSHSKKGEISPTYNPSIFKDTSCCWCVSSQRSWKTAGSDQVVLGMNSSKAPALKKAAEMYLVINGLEAKRLIHDVKVKFPGWTGLSNHKDQLDGKILFLVNPVSGNGNARKLMASGVLEKCSGLSYDVLETTKKEDAIELIKERLKMEGDSLSAVVAVGGDGHIHDVINAIQNLNRSDIKIGVLPGGTSNAQCTSLLYLQMNDLSVNQTPLKLLAMILQGNHTPIDLIKVTNRSEDDSGDKILYAHLLVMWGFLSQVDLLSDKFRSWGNDLKIVFSFLDRLWHFPKFHGRISVQFSGEKEWKTILNDSQELFNALVLNSPWISADILCDPECTPFDGTISLQLTTSMHEKTSYSRGPLRRSQILQLFLADGKKKPFADYSFIKTYRNITKISFEPRLESDTSLNKDSLNLDGERMPYYGRTEMEVIPNAVNILQWPL